MGELWKAIHSEVVAVLIMLIPVAGAAAATWLRHKSAQWADAKQARREAQDLSDSIHGHIPEATVERWAVRNLLRKKPNMKEERALDMVRRVASEVPPTIPPESLEEDPDQTLPGIAPLPGPLPPPRKRPT